MPSVCFYFQVHQPFRLKRYSFFNIGNDHAYEDDNLNKEILNKVSDKCYLPANKLMLSLIKKHKGKFRIAFSLSGVAIDQFEKHRPDVLESFIELSKTEFVRQVEKHKKKIKQHFDQTPTVFRNTELIYNNDLANFVQKMGYKGILSEGLDWILNGRSPHFVYSAPNNRNMHILLKNFKLSDDIAFRFSNASWPEYPLTATKYAKWIHHYQASADCINLFMDYETFGEHQWQETGIFQFLEHLPAEVLKNKSFDFKTPSEVIDTYKVKGIYDVHHSISWADTERDLSAWLSNPMQAETLSKVYAMEDEVLMTNDKKLLEKWSRMQISDHFYYMSTKYWSDGEVHKYFSPFASPYDSYIYYINALSDLELQIHKQHALMKQNR